MTAKKHPDALIHVGNNVDERDTNIAAVAAAIVAILKAGADNHTDQTTICRALTALAESTPGPHDVTIQHSTLYGGDAPDTVGAQFDA